MLHLFVVVVFHEVETVIILHVHEVVDACYPCLVESLGAGLINHLDQGGVGDLDCLDHHLTQLHDSD